MPLVLAYRSYTLNALSSCRQFSWTLRLATKRFVSSAKPIQEQNYIIVTFIVIYNIRGDSYSPLHFPLGLRTFALRLTISLPSSEGLYRPEYNPLYPLPYLLLKPISAIRLAALLSLQTDIHICPLRLYRQYCTSLNLDYHYYYILYPTAVKLLRITQLGLPLQLG